jgi:hypothetical protein
MEPRMSLTFEPADRLFETGDYRAAHAAYRRLAQAAPESVRAHLMAATALLRMGELDAAIRAFESVVERAPDQPLPRYRLAVALALAGRRDEALASLDAAAEVGFRQSEELALEPAFAPWRLTPEFASSLERARRNEHPCAVDPAHRAFDFWIGRWRAYTPEGVLAGTNEIEAILGGAALVERWRSMNGYAGTSLNRYDAASGAWRQTWIDDQGDVVEFTDGRFADGAMRFRADTGGVLRRLTFFDQGPNTLRQLSEGSEDGGATWSIEYDLRDRRLADPRDARGRAAA